MRLPLLAAAILAAAVWPNEARLTLVSASGILLEALPFVLAGVCAERVLGKKTQLVAYAGCGCSAGPSARSLPAAALAWFAFGPLPAVARVAAATFVDRRLHRRHERTCGAHAKPDLVAELERLVPFAIASALGGQIAVQLDFTHAVLALQIAAGAVLGFFASPCAIGAIAVASGLRADAGASAAAFLCVAGIADLHALRGGRIAARGRGDALAYAVLAAGAALVAARHGAALVHPGFALPLAICAAVSAALVVVHRNNRAPGVRLAPAIVLLGALTAVPPPVYSVTETTLAQIFPGERLSFTGVLARDRHTAALVRYAITCCRADAAPIVVRLTRPPGLASGTWARADGTIVATPSGFALSLERITPVPPPSDPFLYR